MRNEVIPTDGSDAFAAFVEMPAWVLVDAVRASLGVEFSGAGPAALERHPAIAGLTGWWNRNAPDRSSRCAGMVLGHVRSEDDPDFCETLGGVMPGMDWNDDGHWQGISACVGGRVVLVFLKSQLAFDGKNGTYGPIFLDVLGRYFLDVGIPVGEVLSGEHDEAWYGLVGLQGLPGEYPGVWDDLVRQADRERRPKTVSGRLWALVESFKTVQLFKGN